MSPNQCGQLLLKRSGFEADADLVAGWSAPPTNSRTRRANSAGFSSAGQWPASLINPPRTSLARDCQAAEIFSPEAAFRAERENRDLQLRPCGLLVIRHVLPDGSVIVDAGAQRAGLRNLARILLEVFRGNGGRIAGGMPEEPGKQIPFAPAYEMLGDIRDGEEAKLPLAASIPVRSRRHPHLIAESRQRIFNDAEAPHQIRIASRELVSDARTMVISDDIDRMEVKLTEKCVHIGGHGSLVITRRRDRCASDAAKIRRDDAAVGCQDRHEPPPHQRMLREPMQQQNGIAVARNKVMLVQPVCRCFAMSDGNSRTKIGFPRRGQLAHLASP